MERDSRDAIVVRPSTLAWATYASKGQEIVEPKEVNPGGKTTRLLEI